jgi:hypothetical protein
MPADCRSVRRVSFQPPRCPRRHTGLLEGIELPRVVEFACFPSGCTCRRLRASCSVASGEIFPWLKGEEAIIPELPDESLRRQVRAQLAARQLFLAHGVSSVRRGTGRPCAVCGRQIDAPTLEREVEGPGVVARASCMLRDLARGVDGSPTQSGLNGNTLRRGRHGRDHQTGGMLLEVGAQGGRIDHWPHRLGSPGGFPL